MLTELAASIHAPFKEQTFIPSIEDRPRWDALDPQLKKKLLHLGESCLNYHYPQITAADYMEFSRTGNRSNYQEKAFNRRIALNHLVLAECLEDQGRFIDDIINGLVLICEESAWQIPAHNSYIRDTVQFNLPDITRPVIDLFAAETGAVLGVAEALLRPRLAAVSPFISVMIQDKINRRIIEPYLNCHFWWMGDGISKMNNWTVWCTQNVLLASFCQTLPDHIQTALIQKACQSTDYFLADYGEDGCCDEGAGYYRHAGLCLFNIIEILNYLTGQVFMPLYQETKICNIAAYIRNVHVDDACYINFADCSPLAGRCNAREFLFGERTGNHDLMAFSAADYKRSEDPLLMEEHNLYYRLQTLSQHQAMSEYSMESATTPPDCYYESTGLWIARDSTFCLAVKAGGNADSHNHNDTGSFILYKHGKPMFIDVGVETYTKNTFSPKRYELWPMQSGYHNLLTFGRTMQKDGRQYKAKDVTVALEPSRAAIAMELADAYPAPGPKSYRRNVIFAKEEIITITDTFKSSQTPVVLSLMTYEKPSWLESSQQLQIGTLGTCRIKGAKIVTIESIPITDARLSQAWKHAIYRTLITVEGSQIQLEIQ